MRFAHSPWLIVVVAMAAETAIPHQHRGTVIAHSTNEETKMMKMIGMGGMDCDGIENREGGGGRGGIVATVVVVALSQFNGEKQQQQHECGVLVNKVVVVVEGLGRLCRPIACQDMLLLLL